MASHHSVRSGIIELASSLLLGPMAPDESLSSAPGDTYLTGILWPEGEENNAADDDQGDGAASDQDGENDAAVPGYRAIKPCSIGLTFAADIDAAIKIDLGKTARYTRVECEPPAGADSGRKKILWKRQQLGYAIEIKPHSSELPLKGDFVSTEGKVVSDPSIEIHIKRRIVEKQQVITATLINRAKPSDDQFRDENCLFQSGLVVTCTGEDGLGAIRPRKVLAPIGGDEDEQSAALLYRDAVEYAVGHGVAVGWDEPKSRRVGLAETRWIPQLSVKGMNSQGSPRLAEFISDHPEAFTAGWLAGHDESEVVLKALESFVGNYGDWVEEVIKQPDNTVTGDLRLAAERHYENCTEALRRMNDGIACLRTSSLAWDSFRLMNEAMDRQSRYDAKGEQKRPLRWRPFQLAYILLVISGLAYPEENPDRDCMDLLWFPTGGGKTEAYLGLTAFQIFLDRLKNADRRDRGGVDVLMRYTLRLLTVQQFQRAASLICACDAIRREREDLGTAPINLGLYVGREATPNSVEQARIALAEENDGLGPKSTPRQLLVCPVCGSDLPASCYEIRVDSSAIDIVCANAACETGGHALPVLTVDELIYASPPSLLIGTIDKFAQLPRRDDMGVLFGLDGRLPPGLIIQDELHLISGPLGSMAGLYETVIDLLCVRDGVRAKVIGSTATIGQAARQVRSLFDRPVMQFPPPGLEAADSFFAVRDEDGPDRIFLGVSTAGRSPKFALQAVAAALLQVPHELLHRGEAPSDVDPYWTAVLYFNSLRELGGAHVLMEDDVPRQIEFLASRMDGAGRLMERQPVELSSRVPSRDLPVKLKDLATRLDSAMNDPFAPDPADTVLASNMISVGVDVPRLGLMIVNGQPKSTAEYIQASSRVGRGIPGLVVTIYNFGRPRDVSHFEHFCGYHAALYRSVEATSVTPWAPRARDKALHAVVASAVRYHVDGMQAEGAAQQFVASNPAVMEILKFIIARAESASRQTEGDDTNEDLKAITREWAQRSNDARTGGTKLFYWEKKAPYGRTQPHLMTSAEEGGRRTVLAWPTPNSMREVEPSTAFSIKNPKKN